MIFNLTHFLPAIFLLWLPVPATPAGTKNYGQMQTPGWPAILRAWQNWLDLARAAAGAYLLLGDSIRLDMADPQTSALATYLKAGILAVGVIIQTLSFETGLRFFVPLFYFSGLAGVAGGYLVGVFAVLFAWALAIMAKEPRFHPAALGISLALAAFCYDCDGLIVWVICGCTFLPQALGFVFQQDVLFTTFQKKTTSDRPVLVVDKPLHQAAKPAGRKTLPVEREPSLAREKVTD